ncbi:MAG TPA: four helix bundle protein [Gemmatimonadaceae bacterium]|nr:four helix bundle protein [Gemmatimonadaceae bacterium]
MHIYRQLKAWQLAQEVGELLTTAFAPVAQYRTPGLRTQAIRAAHSISANICEGCSRRSPAEFRRYLEISLGSVLEVENDLMLAARCNVMTQPDYWKLKTKCAVLRRMLAALIQRHTKD